MMKSVGRRVKHEYIYNPGLFSWGEGEGLTQVMRRARKGAFPMHLPATDKVVRLVLPWVLPARTCVTFVSHNLQL